MPIYDDEDKYRASPGDKFSTIGLGALSGSGTGAALGSIGGPATSIAGALLGGVTGLVGGIGDIRSREEAAAAAADQQKRLEAELARRNTDLELYQTSVGIDAGLESDRVSRQTQDLAARAGLNEAQAFAIDQQAQTEVARRAAAAKGQATQAAVQAGLAQRESVMQEYLVAQQLANSAQGGSDNVGSWGQALGAAGMLLGNSGQLGGMRPSPWITPAPDAVSESIPPVQPGPVLTSELPTEQGRVSQDLSGFLGAGAGVLGAGPGPAQGASLGNAVSRGQGGPGAALEATRPIGAGIQGPPRIAPQRPQRPSTPKAPDEASTGTTTAPVATEPFTPPTTLANGLAAPPLSETDMAAVNAARALAANTPPSTGQPGATFTANDLSKQMDGIYAQSGVSFEPDGVTTISRSMAKEILSEQDPARVTSLVDQYLDVTEQGAINPELAPLIGTKVFPARQGKDSVILPTKRINPDTGVLEYIDKVVYFVEDVALRDNLNKSHLGARALFVAPGDLAYQSTITDANGNIVDRKEGDVQVQE